VLDEFGQKLTWVVHHKFKVVYFTWKYADNKRGAFCIIPFYPDNNPGMVYVLMHFNQLMLKLLLLLKKKIRTIKYLKNIKYCNILYFYLLC